jgi:hypothetical protein
VRVSAANSSETHYRLLLPASVGEDLGGGNVGEDYFSVQICTVNMIIDFEFPQKLLKEDSAPWCELVTIILCYSGKIIQFVM